MVVQEFQTVALTDEIAVAVVAEGNVILFGSATACVVCEGCAVVRLERSATLPDSRLSAVGGRVAARLSIPYTALLTKTTPLKRGGKNQNIYLEALIFELCSLISAIILHGTSFNILISL